MSVPQLWAPASVLGAKTVFKWKAVILVSEEGELVAM